MPHQFSIVSWMASQHLDFSDEIGGDNNKCDFKILFF